MLQWMYWASGLYKGAEAAAAAANRLNALKPGFDEAPDDAADLMRREHPTLILVKVRPDGPIHLAPDTLCFKFFLMVRI